MAPGSGPPLLDVDDIGEALKSMDSIMRNLELLGVLRPKEVPGTRAFHSKGIIYYFLVCQTLYHGLATDGVYLYQLDASIEDFGIELAQMLLLVLLKVCFLNKMMTFYKRSGGIYELVDTMRRVREMEVFNDWTVRSTLAKARIVTRRIEWFFFLTSGVIVPALAFISLALQFKAGQLAFRGWYPLDVTKSPGLEITLIALAVPALFIPLVIGQLNTFLVCALYDTMTQFRLLGHKIRHVRQQAVSNVTRRRRHQDKMVAIMTRWRGKSLPGNQAAQGRVGEQDGGDWQRLVDDEMCRLLANLVDQHAILVKLTKDFQEIFNPIMMCQVISNLFLTSMCLFLVTKNGLFSQKSLPMIEMTLLLVSELYLYCYLTDNISEQSARLRDCAYSCAWLRSSARFSKSLRVVMSMSNRDLRVRVAGHVPLSMETFAQITKFSWSILTLAKSLTDPARQR